jgi:hypothetical protein
MHSHTQSKLDFPMFLLNVTFIYTSLSILLHPLQKDLQNHLGVGYVEMACLVQCAAQRERQSLFIKTARDILSHDPTNERLVT